MAVPLAVAALTDTVDDELVDRVTVKVAATVPELPSVTVTSLIEMVTMSSSVMVPVAWLSAMVAFVGLVRLTTKVSGPSEIVSFVTGTVTVAVVRPAAIEAVPETAVKSVPDVAVAPAVA